MPLEGKRILLGVCGSIAAYKAAELAREFLRAGASVQVVLTPHAARFVTPLTFTALTGQPCEVDDFTGGGDVYAHLNLTRRIDAFVVAPLSAESLAQLAQGGAGNLLCACYLSNTAPVVLAPAMNVRMWQHPAVQANAQRLRERGNTIVGPGSGELACGDEGEGRLAEIGEIVKAVSAACGLTTPASGPLTGKRIVVSAGGTREYLDPVRFITNASSGTLALEACAALASLGAQVDLVHTGIGIPPSQLRSLAAITEARTAFDLQAALQKAFADADALVMLAAVADYGPASYEPAKHKKTGAAWALELTETPDILCALSAQRRPGQIICGVSLEDTDWLARGQAKARRKGMDLCLAVELGADLPFGPRNLHCALVDGSAVLEEPQQVSKSAAAAWIAEALARRLLEQPASPSTLEHTPSAQEA